MMARAFGAVFRKPRYAFVAVGAAFLLLFAASWLRNLSFLWFLLTSPQFDASIKFKVFTWTFTNLALNSSPLRFTLLIAAAVLAGINIALLTFYLRKQLVLGKEAGASAGGLLVSALGVGCASCGSVLLTSLFGFSAGVGVLAALPLAGAEFTLLGIGLLVYSIFTLAKKIVDPRACSLPHR